jgi:uncharacterized ion transporter superfamily protein YfcC
MDAMQTIWVFWIIFMVFAIIYLIWYIRSGRWRDSPDTDFSITAPFIISREVPKP